MALDERLHNELERAARPADPSGIYEDLLRRRGRRQVVRRVERGLLAVAVILGSIAGVYGLSRVFEADVNTPGNDPSPMPIVPHENGLIAYSLLTSEGMELHTVRLDGTMDRVVPTPPGQPRLHAWSPDGSKLAVAIFPEAGGARSIWVMNADGSEAQEIATAENVSEPSWSPDGETVAYAASDERRTEIHLWTLGGIGDRIIHAADTVGYAAIFSVQFSPDGTKILFDRGGGRSYIFVMNIDENDMRRLTTTGTDYVPHWSPDGSQIAFTREEFNEEVVGSDIFVMNADGSDKRPLTNASGGATNVSPHWAPDGTKIAYVAGVDGGPGALMVMNADGSDPQTLIDGNVLGISWQPLPEGDGISPTPSPSETISEDPPSESTDIGLGFPVCDVTSVAGEFATGVPGLAYVATRMGDTGGCPRSGFQVVAVDVTGDGVADTSAGPLECEQRCSAFAAPDVDGDGTDELLIQNIEFSIAGLRLYEVRADPPEVVAVTVSTPGYPEGDLPPGAEPQLWIGGDGFQSDTLRCETVDGLRVLIQASASLDPPEDSPDAVWKGSELAFSLQDDGTVAVVSHDTFEEPIQSDSPSLGQANGLCGTRLPPPFGTT